MPNFSHDNTLNSDFLEVGFYYKICFFNKKSIYTNKNKLKKTIFMKLTKEQIMGIVRHTLTFVGGILVMKGLLTRQQLQKLLVV